MRKVIFSVFTSFSAFAVLAAPVTPEQALERAVQTSPAKIAGKSGGFKLVHTERSASSNAIYVFSNLNSESFLVTPADDCAPAVLGYGDSKIFDENGEMAPGFVYWMGEYSRQIEYAASTSPQTGKLKLNRPEREPIGIMCSTRWNQGTPYNLGCPKIKGEYCVTGCVATAMAQVMKYHNWPDVGEGEVGTFFQGRKLKLDLSLILFKWEDMLDTYGSNSSKDSQKEVAMLMTAAGYSVGMDYNPNGSGAQSVQIAPALGRNFKYNKSLRYLQRDYYNLLEWEDLIYNSLATYGPVIYDGQSGAGGHSFVCDGYQGNGYFHFNWGWGGLSDGYFLLDALDPMHQGIGGADGGFDYMQDVIVDIRPDKEGTSQYAYQMCMRDIPEYAIESDEYGKYVVLETPFYNFGPGTMKQPSVGLKAVNIDEPSADPVYLMEEIGWSISLLNGISGIGFYFSQLPPGKYEITPVCADGDNEPEPVMIPIYYATKTIVTVDGDDGSVDSKTVEAPDFLDARFMTKIKKTDPVRIKGTLVNNNDTPYLCFFSEVICDLNMHVVAYSMPRVYDLEPKESVEIDLTAVINGLSSLPDGEYYFFAGELILSAGSVNILSEPTKIIVGDPSGIDNIIDQNLKGKKEYYNTEGVKIATVNEGDSAPHLPTGLYIVKTADKTVKIFIK